MANQTIKSIEPIIAELGNGWLKSYKLDYKLEQEPLNAEIDQALNDYFSKNGGKGGNRPDAKLLLRADDGKYYPILIEYKGYKDRLAKLDGESNVDNKSANNRPDFSSINSYAVNGAVHYANAILHYTSYTDVIAVGMTGYKDISDNIVHQIGVYYVSKSNFGVGQKVNEYTDFSFLKKEHFGEFIEKVKRLQLSPKEIEMLKERRDQEITTSLVKLNNDIFKNENGLSENDRVYLVAASIMATLGDVEHNVYPLTKADLKSSDERNNTDGEILLRKIESFLDAKKLPKDKKNLIVRTLQNTLTTDNINKTENGESQLKRVFVKIVDDLGIYYKIGLTTDFTGKLFNEMYSWLGFTQDQLNDVVLTPSYVATLLCRLARVDMDSFVWDFATGSAGLLVAAMNEMLIDAKSRIRSPEKLAIKSAEIKANQLLGLEYLPNIYMLAVLNMIMMGDGCSNILNKDSLNFDGNYGFEKTNEKFPATAFVLNPPYSREGNGMIFVEKALSMMDRGYAAIIIQNSAGSGKASSFNQEILKHSTLLASIKMPIDLFIGKSSVQTYVYVFRVGEAHQKDDTVKFIDFSNDGYTRTNRKKASRNLYDSDRAQERYQEVVDLVRFGKSKLSIFTEKEYFEGHIDPNNGADWNQTAPVDTKPLLEDFNKTVSGYLAWEVTDLLSNQNIEKINASLKEQLSKVEWKEYRLGDLFEVESYTKRFDANKVVVKKTGTYPYIVRTSANNGQKGFIDEDVQYLNDGNTIAFGQDTATMFYQEKPYFTGDKIKILKPKSSMFNKKNAQFFLAAMRKPFESFSWGNSSFSVDVITEQRIMLPVKHGRIDYDFMESFIAKLQSEQISRLSDFLNANYPKTEL